MNTRLFPTLALLLCLGGCGGLIDTNPIAKSLETVAVEVGKIKDVDPLAINRVLQDNADLLKRLTDATVLLSGVSSGQGVIALTNRRLQLRVVESRGAFFVRGWLDDPTNEFWKADVADVQETLPWDFNKAIVDAFHDIGTPICKGDYECGRRVGHLLAVPAPEGHLPALAAGLGQYSNGVFQSWLAGNHRVTGMGFLSDDLQGKLGTAGTLHRITVQVTPQVATTGGQWSMRVRLFEVTGAGNELPHGTYDFSSGQYPKHRLGSPLPLYHILLMVARDTGAAGSR